jgi:HlyD family secretion protein
MDRVLAPEVRRNRIARRGAIGIVAVLAAAFSIAATVQWLRPSVSRRNLQTARVDRGSVDATLQAAGTILPAVEQVVSSPVEARLLRIMRRAGDRVRAGDELVALDTSASRLDVERLDDRVAQKESETAQTRLKLQETLASLRAQIEQKKLDGEIFRYKAEQNEKLHGEGLVAQTENLAAATAAKKSDIELAQLHDALARAERSAAAELTSAALELRTLRNERDEAKRQLTLAMMRADRDGVVTSIVQDAGATIRRGDIVARIADLSSFRVVATISDVHAAELAPGQRVRVKLDDATTIGGTISSIDPRTENGATKFSVELAQPSHPRLRNSVRVDVFVIAGRRDGVLRVRRGALGQSDAEDVFVVRGGELVQTPVRWGLAGEETIEIQRGLAEGDEVVISNMSDYAGMKRLREKP